MAGVESLTDQDIFECSVCLSNMLNRTPRSLQCLHTFCTECLTQLIQGNAIHCPICRESTELKGNNVEELKVNFMLSQIKDQMKNQEMKTKDSTKKPEKAMSACQICQQNEPLFKCKECSHILCTTCKDTHDEFPGFQSHSVLDLCVKHEDGITHFCKKCVIPLCMRCMFLDHKQHAEHCVDYNSGVQQVQQKCRTLQDNIKAEMSKMDDHLKCEKQKKLWCDDAKVKLLEKRAHYAKIIKETDDLIKSIDSNNAAYEKLEKSCNKTKDQGLIAVTSFNAILQNPSGICKKYLKLKHKGEQSLADIQTQLEIKCKVPPSVYFDDLQSTIKPEDVVGKKLILSKLLLTVNKSDEIKCGYQMAFIGSDVVLKSLNTPAQVTRLNPQGQVVGRYYAKDKDQGVNGVAVYKDKVYIVQAKTITVISHTDGEGTAVYKPGIDNMDKILVKDNTTIFVSDYRIHGCIYKYDTELNKAEVMVRNLDVPSYMSLMNTQQGDRYVVTEYGSRMIKIYDSRWNLIHTFGGEGSQDGKLTFPYSTAVTETGILVTQNNNHRISHFTKEGTFISHLITKQDGVAYPLGIAYKYPHIWLCGGSLYVKCFEVKYQ